MTMTCIELNWLCKYNEKEAEAAKQPFLYSLSEMQFPPVSVIKGNLQVVQKVTFKPLINFKQNHYGS